MRSSSRTVSVRVMSSIWRAPTMSLFARRPLIRLARPALEYGEKRVDAAILLTHKHTDTSWFHSAAEPLGHFLRPF